MIENTNSDTNIYLRFAEQVAALPQKNAIVEEHRFLGHRTYKSITFLELNNSIVQATEQLLSFGLKPGMRVILFVPPGFDFFTLAFALFKLGAIPVLIDPGMPRNALIQCLQEVNAHGFISINKGHLVRWIYRMELPIDILINVGSSVPFAKSLGIHQLNVDYSIPSTDKSLSPAVTGDMAAILFTSGSTGIPKGTVYTHRMFNAQIDVFKNSFGYSPEEIDVPTFPHFALFDVALGMTAVVPQMNYTRPGFVHPPNILQVINDYNATHIFGSPALLDRVGSWAKKNNVRIHSIKRVMTAGAPVRPDILETLKSVLDDDAEIYTAYGATESLPIAFAPATMIVTETAKQYYQGAGTCIGHPVPQVAVSIIKVTDDPITDNTKLDFCAPNEIGEIVVDGPMVTQEYYNKPAETEKAKILNLTKGDVMHRMGDCGYLDNVGRLWFCGRKSQRLRTSNGNVFTEPIEGIANRHPAVYRSALVGIGDPNNEVPVLWLELRSDTCGLSQKQIADECCKNIRESFLKTKIEHVLFKGMFPVDIRHNAKIFREKLKDEAGQLLIK